MRAAPLLTIGMVRTLVTLCTGIYAIIVLYTLLVLQSTAGVRLDVMMVLIALSISLHVVPYAEEFARSENRRERVVVQDFWWKLSANAYLTVILYIWTRSINALISRVIPDV